MNLTSFSPHLLLCFLFWAGFLETAALWGLIWQQSWDLHWWFSFWENFPTGFDWLWLGLLHDVMTDMNTSLLYMTRLFTSL